MAKIVFRVLNIHSLVSARRLSTEIFFESWEGDYSIRSKVNEDCVHASTELLETQEMFRNEFGSIPSVLYTCMYRYYA